MSSCISGGGRAYGFDLEIIKSPSTSSRISSSPSSTISESSNSQIAISTRKPRTPRKRPNQTYNEAAALLSTAYPKIFSTKNLKNPCKFTKAHTSFPDDPSELLLPFRLIDTDASCFLLHQPMHEKPNFLLEHKAVNSRLKQCSSPVENDFQGNSFSPCDGYVNASPMEHDSEQNSSDGYFNSSENPCVETDFQGNPMNCCDDFDAESMLDEEIEEGIDSIMGNLSVNNETIDESNRRDHISTSCFGYPMGLGFGGSFDFGFGMKGGVKALRNVDEGNWWQFPAVDMVDITPPKFKKPTVQKKKKKKVEKMVELKSLELEENLIPDPPEEDPGRELDSGLHLKLNYDEVLSAWSGRGSPFPDELLGSESSDVHARLAQINLFSDGGGLREASVMRYKEKRRTRLFSKKIRYQVRKVNADQRPRMK
ncbi:hypothetical protein RJ639_026221, partial [Escallonia herrerae]